MSMNSCSHSASNSNPKMGNHLVFRNVPSSVILLKFCGSRLGLSEYKPFLVSLQSQKRRRGGTLSRNSSILL